MCSVGNHRLRIRRANKNGVIRNTDHADESYWEKTKRRVYEPSFVFAAAGRSILVVPTSLISTVVVRSTCCSPPRPWTVPFTWYSYFETTPSFSQNLTVPE